MVRFIVFGILLAVSSLGHANARTLVDMQTGNDVLAACTDTSALQQGLCLGFILGAMQRDNLVEWSKTGGNYLCDASERMKGASYGQLRDVVVKSLQDRPETRHHQAASTVLRSLQLAFCK